MVGGVLVPLKDYYNYYNYYFFWPFTENSVKREAIPKLLKLLKEQQNNTFRAAAKPPNNSNENFDELRDSSEDENSRVKGEQVTRMKRRAFSFAGLPVLASTTIRKQGEGVYSNMTFKQGSDANKVLKSLRRRSYTVDLSSVIENMLPSGRARMTNAIHTVCEESQDGLDISDAGSKYRNDPC